MHAHAHSRTHKRTHLVILLRVFDVQVGQCLLQAAVVASLATHGGTHKHETMAHDRGFKQLDDLCIDVAFNVLLESSACTLALHGTHDRCIPRPQARMQTSL